MPVLCPTLVPEPTLPGVPGGRRATWQTVLDPGGTGYEISYGAPWEAGSGRGWKGHLWRNRPCCFFHFTLEPDLGNAPASGAYFFFGKHPPEQRAVVGGYHGTLSDITIADHIIFSLHSKRRPLRRNRTLLRAGNPYPPQPDSRQPTPRPILGSVRDLIDELLLKRLHAEALGESS